MRRGAKPTERIGLGRQLAPLGEIDHSGRGGSALSGVTIIVI
jgi:hypothetical protein